MNVPVAVVSKPSELERLCGEKNEVRLRTGSAKGSGKTNATAGYAC